MDEKQMKYLAYLLRLWRVEEAEGIAWRVSLVDVATRERVGFESLEKAVAFLEERMGVERSLGKGAKQEPTRGSRRSTQASWAKGG